VTRAPAASPSAWKRCTGWLLVALVLCALINFAIVAFFRSRGESGERAFEASGLLLTPRLFGPTGVDSIRPMAAAYVRQQQSGDMYWVMLVKGVKFQYPPSALLVMKLLPQPISSPVSAELAALQTKPSLFAIMLTIVCTGLLWLKLMAADWGAPAGWSRWQVLGSLGLIGALGVSYYPLLKGHNLGQIQVYLGALSALALLLQELELSAVSGACLGVCCLIKPQFGVLMLWALLRRQKHFLIGFGAVVGLGLWLSLSEFGLRNHLQYLEVLQHMSRRGEAYWPNQSVNGLLNRVLQNGNAIKFQSHAFAPYHPVVYYASLLTSGLFVALSLLLPTAASMKGRGLDLAVVMCAATMASPIAWEHHYGAFFPMFAIALVSALRSARAGLWLMVSYELVANELLRPQLVFEDRWTGLLGSHIFFGALLLFGFLLWVRARGVQAGAAHRSM
jgi:alpha-1,2-mannosyltransferase